MKYILIFLFALLCSVGYAQFPVNQYMGSQTTLVTARGGLKADSSLILPQFPDTASANKSPYIKFYPGNLIRVFNDIYMRNTTATKWELINGGGTGGNNFIDSLRKVGDSVFARKYGVFVYQYTDSAQNILANNGLSFLGDTLQLGGSLIQNTTITGTQKELKLDSIDFEIRDDSLFRRFYVTNNDINTGQKENYLGALYYRDINLDPVPKHEIWISQTPGTGNLIAAKGLGQETNSFIRVDTGIIKIQVPDANLQIDNLQYPPIGGLIRPLVLDVNTDKVYQWEFDSIAALTKANNGLSKSGDTIQLGGNLIKNTNIIGKGYGLNVDSTDYIKLRTNKNKGSNFVALNQTYRNWRGIATAPNGDIYVTVFNGDIWKSTNNGITFNSLGQVAREWISVAVAPNGDVYIASRDNNSDIYKSTNGGSTFTALNAGNKLWFGLAVAPNGDIYATASNEDIYKSTNNGVTFSPLSAGAKSWAGITVTSNGDIYAAEISGDIYKSTNGGTTFVGLGQTTRDWFGMATLNGDVYATVLSGDIYRQANGIGNFIALNQASRLWFGITSSTNGNLYATDGGGDIYISEGSQSNIDIYTDSIVINPYGADSSLGNLQISKLKYNSDTTGYFPLMWNKDIKKLEAYTGGFGNLGIDTTSLSNRINERIDSLKRSNDSVYARKNGVFVFQYRDSVGNAGGGGGGGKIYYLNGGVSLGTFGGIPMYELGDTAVIGTAANFTRNTTGNIANFITDVGKPGLLQIPSGVWTIDAFLSETGGGSNHAQIYAVLEKWDGTTLTTIATSPVEEITNGNIPDLYTYSISVPTTTISVTDRIVIQFYIQNTNGKTVTLYTQNGYVGEVHTTFTTGIGSLNGLVTPSQTFATGTSGSDFNIQSVTSTHTFNLPTASATNRGALSSADWSTFNGKLGSSDTISLSNRINTKLNISDTANTWVTSVFRKTASDSVFFVRGGSNNFAFRDSTGAAGWGLLGNSGTNATTNFIGTTDNVNLVFRRNNVISATIDSSLFESGGNGGRTSFGFRTTGTAGNLTAFGYKALSLNNTFSNLDGNTAVGNRAGQNITTETGNAILGHNSNSVGNTYYNTAIGSLTLTNNTTGNNTACGYSALRNTTSGQSNLAIGRSSGVYNTTGSNQIFINSLDRSNYSGDQNNSPFYAQQNSTVANQIVTLNGRIGINTISPNTSSALDITSTTRGFLQPRVTTTEMNAISTPATGLSVFNTTDSVPYTYRGTTGGWQKNVIYNRNNDVALFNGANQRIMIDTTTNVIAGRSLTVEAGSTQAGGSSAFSTLLQGNRAWTGITVAPNGDVYAAVENGDIWKRTGGTGNFAALNAGNRTWSGMAAAPNGDIYVTVNGGDVWKSTNAGTTFTSLSAGNKDWTGITVAPNGDVYAAVRNGDIWISTNAGTTFTALSQTSRNYRFMAAASNGDIYVCVYADVIYRRAGGTGNFTALSGVTARNWQGISVASNGDIYACTWPSGDIYRQTGGSGDLIALNQTARTWIGMAIASNGDIYATTSGADIYLQGQGTANLNGGTLVLQSGAGKGTGTSIINFNTTTPTVSGNVVQTASTKMTILGNGNVGIGTTSPSAKLELSDTARGFLQTRMTTTQRNNIASPSAGLQVFTTTDSSQYVYRGTGAGWQQLANEIFNTASLNFPSTNAQTSSDLTITLTGAVDGDAVVLGVPNAAVNANSCYTAWVSAANTVTVRFNNYSSGAIDPAQATFKVTIIK